MTDTNQHNALDISANTVEMAFQINDRFLIWKEVLSELHKHEVRCRRRVHAETVQRLVEAGESDFRILTKNRHKFLFCFASNDDIIKIGEMPYAELAKLHILIKEYREYESRTNFRNQSEDSTSFAGIRTVRGIFHQAEGDQVFRASQLQLAGDSQSIQNFEVCDPQVLPSESFGGRNGDVSGESPQNISTSATGIHKNVSFIRKVDYIYDQLRLAEQRGSELISEGFETIRGESASSRLIGIGKIIAGAGEELKAVANRIDLRESCHAATIECLRGEIAECDRKFKELYRH